MVAVVGASSLGTVSSLCNLLATAQTQGHIRVLSLSYSVDTIQVTCLLFDKEEGIAVAMKAWLHTVSYDNADDLVSELWGSGQTEVIDLNHCIV